MNSNLHSITEKLKINLDENTEFRQLIYIFWENKFLVLSLASFVFIVAAFYIFTKIPEYESNTLIQIEDKNQDDGLNRLSPLRIISSGSNRTAAQIALIQSRVILEPVIEQLGLAISIEPVRFFLFKKLFPMDVSDTPQIEKLMLLPRYYNQQLKLTVIDATHFRLSDQENRLLLTGETGSLLVRPGIAIKIKPFKNPPGSEFYVIRYPNITIMKTILSKMRIEELGGKSSDQTGILQISLRDTDPLRLTHTLNAIVRATQAKSAASKSLETAKTLEFLNDQLPLVKASLEQAEEKLNQYRAQSGKLDIKIQAEQLMEQLANVEKQIAESTLYKSNLLQIYTAKHPLIAEVTDKILQLQTFKHTLQRQIKSLPASDQVAMNLMRDAKVQNDLYLVLLNKIQELQVVSSGTLSDVRILAKAVKPDSALPQPTAMLLTASLVLGLMLGCVGVLARKAFSRTVKDPRWVEQYLNLPCLAIIPYSKDQAKHKDDYRKNLSRRLEILAEKNPHDLSIEALRSLRTSFQIMLAERNKRVITFIGVCEGVGKSFVSTNFSYLLANVDKNVLLIDGDIRRGDIHNYFGVDQRPGLSEVIDGSATLAQAIRQTSAKHLSFLPSGAYPVNPSELLMKNKFKELLQTLSEQFDHVIIDTSPILAVTDSAIIGAISDVNFLIVGSNLHQPEEITLTVKRLEHAGVKLQGIIFNNSKQKTAMYGNYRYNVHSYYGPLDIKSAGKMKIR